MTEPPFYFQAFMHSIETTVLRLWEEFPAMSDKDVEYVYDKLKDYFKKKSQGKDVEEPETISERKQVLIDELLNTIDLREEMEADSPFINNPEYKPTGRPIPNLPAFYLMALNRLIKSLRMWRKEFGSKGYLSFIRNHVI